MSLKLNKQELAVIKALREQQSQPRESGKRNAMKKTKPMRKKPKSKKISPTTKMTTTHQEKKSVKAMKHHLAERQLKKAMKKTNQMQWDLQ